MTQSIQINWYDELLHFSLNTPHSLAIPLDFTGPQPNAFGLPAASSEAFVAGSFVGDVREGGSANCSSVTLNPHGNGTHTECVGHITEERLYVHDCLKTSLIPAWLASVPLLKRSETDEEYPVEGLPDDRLITREALETSLFKVPQAWSEALVLRTLPNDDHKRYRQHSGNQPPYLSLDAMFFLRALGVQHLLVDLPSVDREEDDGLLEAHHIFWSAYGTEAPMEEEALSRTITEMIYVPDELSDGLYLLNLQIPPFCLDAAPSRPLLYPQILDIAVSSDDE